MNTKIAAALKRVAAANEDKRAPSTAALKIAGSIKRRFRTRNFSANDGSIHVLFEHNYLPDHTGFKVFLDQLGFKATKISGKPNEWRGGVVVYGELNGEEWISVAFSPDTASALISDVTPTDQ